MRISTACPLPAQMFKRNRRNFPPKRRASSTPWRPCTLTMLPSTRPLRRPTTCWCVAVDTLDTSFVAVVGRDHGRALGRCAACSPVLTKQQFKVAVGAGMSAAAGVDYTSRSVFKAFFPDMVDRGFVCMYQFIGHHFDDAGLQWGYLARYHSAVCLDGVFWSNARFTGKSMKCGTRTPWLSSQHTTCSRYCCCAW
jgi:hypothetical protein